MVRTLLIALLIYCTTLTATAQQTETAPAPPKIFGAGTVSAWPHTRWSLPHRVEVITLSHPGIRQKCEFPDLEADTLTCAASHHHPSTTYRREDIAALIDPPNHSDRNWRLAMIAFDAACLAGSFFVPLAASVILRVLTGLLLPGLAFVGDGDDHDHDKLLYQRPNTPLTITLRTR